jgi:YCII-related domain
MSARAVGPPGYDRRVDLYAVRERRGGPWDWNLGLREQAGFDEHARFMDDLTESGFVVLGGPLQGDREVLLIIDAPGDDAILARLADDPWIRDGTLTVTNIERWTILLDGR